MSQETSAIGVSKVLFKGFNYTLTNKTDQYAVNIELWEYIPMSITATKSNKGAGSAPQLSQNYENYLDNNRGTAPKQSNKTSQSPAVEGTPRKIDYSNYDNYYN